MTSTKQDIVKVKIPKPTLNDTVIVDYNTKLFVKGDLESAQNTMVRYSNESAYVTHLFIKLYRKHFKENDWGTLLDRVIEAGAPIDNIRLLAQNGAVITGDGKRLGSKLAGRSTDDLKVIFDELNLGHQSLYDEVLKSLNKYQVSVPLLEYLIIEKGGDFSAFLDAEAFLSAQDSYIFIKNNLQHFADADIAHAADHLIVCALKNDAFDLVKQIVNCLPKENVLRFVKEDSFISQYNLERKFAETIITSEELSIQKDYARALCMQAINSNNQVDFKKWFESGKLDIDQEDGELLHNALKAKHYEFAKMLYVEYGASIKKYASELCLQAIQHNNQADFEEYFESCGLDIQHEGEEFLRTALNAGHYEFAKMLYTECGASLKKCEDLDSLVEPLCRSNLEEIIDDLKNRPDAAKVFYMILSHMVEMGSNSFHTQFLDRVLSECKDQDLQGVYNKAFKRKNSTIVTKLRPFIYPRWHKLNDYTIAQTSIIEDRGMDYTVLQRSFNFHAGLVDTVYKQYKKGEQVQMTPTAPISMREIDTQFTQWAKEEMLKRDGHVSYDPKARVESPFKPA